jgi:S1-C subfamily serine protease
MACALLITSINLARILAYCSMLVSPLQQGEQIAEITLVRVNIITETRGAKEAFGIKPGNDYSPTIVQDFSSTGIVIDHKGNVLTFLGYRWVDIQDRHPQVKITTNEGQRLEGKLIGIDQTNSVAVIHTSGKLKKTPICAGCEVQDGDTLISPIIVGPDLSQYQKARILVGTDSTVPVQGSMRMTVNRLFPEIGQPVLTMDHRVLGFIAGQDPADLQTIVYPIDRMMASAEKILKTGSDVRAGWLGVLLLDAQPEVGAGVEIQAVEPDSPAQKAGLNAKDLLQKYNGKEVQNVRQFIQLVEGTPIGSKANIEIIRQGNEKSLTAMIEARKPQQNLKSLLHDLSQILPLPTTTMPAEAVENQPQFRVGLEVAGLTPSLAKALKIPGKTGLLITVVVPQSPAERAGILEGDVIVTINGQPFLDPLSLATYFQNNGMDSQLIMKILRKGTEQTITVQVPDQKR